MDAPKELNSDAALHDGRWANPIFGNEQIWTLATTGAKKKLPKAQSEIIKWQNIMFLPFRKSLKAHPSIPEVDKN